MNHKWGKALNFKHVFENSSSPIRGHDDNDKQTEGEKKMKYISRMMLENPTSPISGHDINDKQSTGKEKTR